MLNRQNLRGTWGTVLLPIAPDESIEWNKLQDEIDFLAASGVHGIYTNGSAGEFFAQTREEFLRLNRMVAHTCRRAGLPFQIGACHPYAAATLDNIAAAASLTPDAFQVILPDWFPVKVHEAISFLQRVAQTAGGTPLVLYLPPHAKSKLTLPELAQLADAVPSLIGVKVAGGPAEWYADLRASGLDVAVFVAGHRLASGVGQGAHGSYSNVACIDPRRAALWYQLMTREPARALAIEQEILACLQKSILPLCAKYVDAAIDKLLAHAGGWGSVGTRLRWPYAFPTETEASTARDGLRDELPQFFALSAHPETSLHAAAA